MSRGRHIAIVASPVPGHYDPLKVLAARLIERGHRITFIHIADAAVLADRFDFLAVGRTGYGPGALSRYTAVLARAGSPAGFVTMIRATARLTEMLLDELPSALDRIDADAVIADSAEPAGALVARHLRMPFITSVTGLPLLREPGVPPPYTGWTFQDDARGRKRNLAGYLVADMLAAPITQAVDHVARRWGLDPAEHGGFSPQLQIAQCPAGLDFPRRELPATFHYCGPWREDDGAPPGLETDARPLVYCSLGSLQGGRPAAFAAMTQACADLGARAVVAHGGRLDEAAARALPGDPIVRAHWHQPSILPRCSAAILHGGFNTVLDALAAGVPMLIAPIAFEQPGTAARVAHIGAGRVIAAKRLTARRIRSALSELLADPSYRAGARRLSADMARLGGADQAAGLVDEVLSAGNRHQGVAGLR